jgi:hypothetical protein
LSHAVDVIDEMAQAAQQAPIFQPSDPAPDETH